MSPILISCLQYDPYIIFNSTLDNEIYNTHWN